MAYIPTIVEDRIAANAVTSAKIAADAVGASEIAADAVGSSEIAADAVGSSELADASVDENALQSAAVSEAKLAAGAVTSAKIGAGAVTTDKLAADAVTGDKIAAGAVGSSQIASGAVGSDEIASGAVGSDEIAAGAVDTAELADGAVTNGKLAADAVDGSKLADDAVGAEHIAAGAVGSSELADDAVTSAKIADGAIMDGDINASAGIALSKLATDPLDRSNHTGTQLASTISDFDTQVRTNRLDQMAAPTGSLSVNSQKITNLATPTANGDAATKAYVDTSSNTVLNALIEAGRGLDVKQSVRVATTANIDLSAPGASIDGVTLAGPSGEFPGDRVLVKNQSTGSQNGIYYFRGDAVPMIRAVDADSDADVTAGMFTFVEEGTSADQGWVLTTNNPITLGTTALAFSQFSGAGQITAGDGLSKTGDELDVNVGYGLEIDADNVAVDDTVIATLDTNQTLAGDKTFSGATSIADLTVTGPMEMQGGQKVAFAAVTDHTVDLDEDYFLKVNSAAGARTITMPDNHTAGQMLYIKRVGANNVSVTSTDLIDGSGDDFVLGNDKESFAFVSDGTDWWVF